MNNLLHAKDPYLLLSVVNTKLRDEAPTIEELCKTYDVEKKEIVSRLGSIGYQYDKTNNQFIAKE